MVAFCLLAACSLHLELTGEEHITCDGDADCPEGLVCAVEIDRCVQAIDREGPRLVSASAPILQRVRLVFNESLGPSRSLPAADSSISPDTAIFSAQVTGSAVELVTAPLAPGRSYTVTAYVVDAQENAIDPAHTSATLTAPGTPPDTTAPERIVPFEDEIRRTDTIEFAWSARVGALSYSFELDDDPDFNDPVRITRTLDGQLTSLSLDVAAEGLEDAAYYWRVRSDATEGSVTAGRFFLLNGAIHVYCPDTALCRCDRAAKSRSSVPGARFARSFSRASQASITIVAGNFPAASSARSRRRASTKDRATGVHASFGE